MLGIDYIRDNTSHVASSMKARGIEVDLEAVLSLDEQRRENIAQIDSLRAKQNETTKELSGAPTPEQLKEMSALKQQISEQEAILNKISAQYTQLLSQIPNVISDDTPIGPDESANTPIRNWGETVKQSKNLIPHEEIAEKLNLLDRERATKLSGSRFVLLKNGLVELELALTNWVFGILTSETVLQSIAKNAQLDVSTRPFELVQVPEVVDAEVFRKMGRYEPKDDKYHINVDDNEQMLIGSAEHVLGALHMDEIVDVSEPLRYVALSNAFRREAGSYGKDTKGLIRLHQFRKIEMESFTQADFTLSQVEQDFFVAIQEHLMQQLKLPYQVVAISSGDMGAPDYRQIDIEAWLPSQNTYRETHTADFMSEYQSRRLNTRYKDGDETKFVHMNDATAVAMPRMFAAILEQYQTPDGSVQVPEVLRPFINREVL